MPRQTLTKRADGRYKCEYQGKYFYGKTITEARAKRDKYKRALEQGAQAASKITVAQYAENWLPTYKADVSAKTFNDYAKQLEKLIGEIGGMQLADVRPSDITRVYNLFVGMSQSLIHRAAMIYVSMFEAAREDGYILRNPCKSAQAKPVKGTAGTHRVITDRERQLIHETDHRMRPLAMVMLYAGLRRGEALALDVDRDVDFKRGTITVREAVRYDSNAAIIDSPKTAAGLRTVPLLPPLRAILQDWHGRLLTSRDGGPATECTFSRGWESYQRALTQAAGKPVDIRCHDLRHSYCTFLRDHGVDMHIAMQWMGHADEKMILHIYDHVTPAREKAAVERLALACGSSGQNEGQ